jgi:CubicO group peptidase (beta-lactamase class C family)
MRFPLLVSVLALSICAPSSKAADDAVPLPKTFDIKAIDAYVADQVRSKGFVGLSLAIMKEGKLVLAAGYGKSSVKNNFGVSLETLFGAGSVTKQFTCACIFLLAEDGKLSIHDKVSKYYPKLTKASDITLYDLMCHVSGYPDYYPLDFVDRRMAKTIALDKLIEEYAGGKLDFEPGTRWSYSNTGYIILGRIIEKVSGKSFEKFLEERILKKVGMEHSILEPKLGTKGVSTGHTSFFLGDPEPAEPEAEGWIHAAGGLFTTPSDLVKWDLALMEGKVVKPESYQLMTTGRKLADGRIKNYGCGLSVSQRDGEMLIQHSGAVSGFHTFNLIIPRTKSALVLMANCDHLDTGSLNNELVALLLKSQEETPQIPTVKGPKPKEAALEFFHQMQAGDIKRDALGEEFNIFMSKERVVEAKDRMKALGEPESVVVDAVYERGGMEVAVVRFTFKGTKMKGMLYRTPDGKIQQFLLYRS